LENECKAVKSASNSNSFIQFAADYEIRLRELFTEYEQSDKSLPILTKLQVKLTTTYPILLMRILISLSSSISTLLNESFVSFLNSTKEEINVLRGLIFVFVVLVSLTIHFWIVNPLKERENEFRKVLEALPAELAFSNFLLKAYILRTSYGMLDSIKNQI